jgi:hypothetical protein
MVNSGIGGIDAVMMQNEDIRFIVLTISGAE